MIKLRLSCTVSPPHCTLTHKETIRVNTFAPKTNLLPQKQTKQAKERKKKKKASAGRIGTGGRGTSARAAMLGSVRESEVCALEGAKKRRKTRSGSGPGTGWTPSGGKAFKCHQLTARTGNARTDGNEITSQFVFFISSALHEKDGYAISAPRDSKSRRFAYKFAHEERASACH